MKSISLRGPEFFSPWNEFQREFDQLFWGKELTKNSESSYWTPKVDYHELDDKFLVSLELPGISKDQIKIEHFDDMLTVSGEKKEEKSTDDGFYSERVYGKFLRSFSLPKGTNIEKIEADLENGILTLVVPKIEVKKPKEIKIGESKGLLSKFLGDGKQDPAA